MKMAHLIMAYKDPSQIERLVRRMHHDEFTFYIHLDKKISDHDFLYLNDIQNVFFTKRRFLIRWGAYSFTNTVLKCMEDILEDNPNYDFINLLSGQDYPLKSTSTIYSFFDENLGNSFFSFEKNGSTWWKENIDRVEKYALTNFKFKGQYPVEKFLNYVLPKRKFPIRSYQLYGGSCCTWWTISREAAEYVLRLVKEKLSLRFFLLFTHIPDEFFIITLLMNSEIKHKIVNNNHRYIDWSNGGLNPKILTINDHNDLLRSSHLFARKFDINVDTDILNMLDKEVVTQNSDKPCQSVTG